MPKRQPTNEEHQQLLDENDALRIENVALRRELKSKDQTIDHLGLKDRAKEKRVKRAQAFGPVPGETMEDKMKFVVGKMRQSPSVYREFEDGRWGIRRRPDLYPPHHRSLHAQYSVRTDHLSESAYR